MSLANVIECSSCRVVHNASDWTKLSPQRDLPTLNSLDMCKIMIILRHVEFQQHCEIIEAHYPLLMILRLPA